MHGKSFVRYLCTKQSKCFIDNTTVPWYSWSLLLRYPDQGISLAKKQQQETPKYKSLTDSFTQLQKDVQPVTSNRLSDFLPDSAMPFQWNRSKGGG